MAKIYTAQEMRDTACRLVGEIETNSPLVDAIVCRAESMLRQAADAMEREKKYEYVLSYNNEIISRTFRDYNTAKDRIDGYIGDTKGIVIVRREVGEWEEVRDGE